MDRAQLPAGLSHQRDAIADGWYRAIARASYVSLEASELRQRLIGPAEQASAVLVADSFEPSQGHAIGVALAQLHCIQPEALEGILEALAHRSVQGLPIDQAAALQPRLAALVGAVAAGFFQQAREMMLDEQEQIRGALLAELGQMMEALRTSEERFRTIVETVPSFLVITDAEGHTTYASPNCEEMIGYTQHELQGELMWWVHEDDLPRAQEVFERVFREEEFGQSLEYKAVKKDGTEWYASSSWELLRDEKGVLEGIVLQTVDITERKQMEEALRESEERYRAVFERAPIGIGVVDGDGNILAFNSTMLGDMGYTREDIIRIGNTAEMYYDPGDRAEVMTTLQKQGFLSQHEVRIKRKDGTCFSALLSVVPIVWGGERCWQVMAEDIDARKRAERQAVQAERMAAMGWLATSLAHEINNPLQAMRSNLELALDFDLEQEEQRDYLDVVRQEIERLARITRRVLDFAHPTEETRYPISIAHLIRTTLRLVGKQLELACIHTTIDLPVDLPMIFVAPDQIIQVLLNLSVNAMEAMPDGGNLYITARIDGDMVVLTLANDGPSLPAENIDHVFDPFFTTKPTGTGLGLPISHSIVHRHGGTISVENLGGDQGVAFTVTLPVARRTKRDKVLI